MNPAALRLAVLMDPALIMDLSGMVADDWQAEAIRRHGPGQYVLILAPRQRGKSLTAAGVAIKQSLTPRSLTLVLSASLRSAQELYRKIRDLLRPIIPAFPLRNETALGLELQNRSRILVLPQSERIRGYSRVDLILLDEAALIHQDTYFAVRPMLGVSGGSLLAISSARLKKGWFHKAWTQETQWNKIEVDISQCKRIQESFLEREQEALPVEWYQREYGNLFQEVGGAIFAEETIAEAFNNDVQPFTFLE